MTQPWLDAYNRVAEQMLRYPNNYDDASLARVPPPPHLDDFTESRVMVLRMAAERVGRILNPWIAMQNIREDQEAMIMVGFGKTMGRHQC